MEKEKKTPQEWEIDVKERFAQIPEDKLLEYAQDAATLLTSTLCLCKAESRDEYDEKNTSFLLARIGKMAVLLDVLQLRYGDASDEEMKMLQGLDAFLSLD